MGLQIVYRSLYSNPRADEVKLASFIGKKHVIGGMENTTERVIINQCLFIW